MYNKKRKTSYKKNNSYGGFKARGVKGEYNSNYTKRNINIFLHPFSVSTVSAKIPDGKVTLSSGQRRQNLTIVDTANPTTATTPSDGIVYIACVPCISTSLIYGASSATDWTPAFFDTTATARLANSMKEFRIVSAGLKISITNNSDQNNGYWEAIRVPLSTTRLAPIATAGTVFWELENYITNTQTFIDQPSYSTGKLKDIHKWVFQCKPDGNQHNLITWQDELSCDNNLDIVLIKITGRAAMGTDGTKLLVHSVSNQEVTYAPTSGFHRFMTESAYDSRFDMAVHANSVNVKAASRNYLNA